MFECFIEKNFTSKVREVIAKANLIIDEYQLLDMRLTLRQLYYQFVSRDWLKNNQRNYDNLGTVVSNARLAGLIDWDAIEDRTRRLRGLNTYLNPADCIETAAQGYFIDLWEGQETRPEVWIEKDALLGVIERPCLRYQVDYFACRGYASQSELYNAGKRIKARRDNEGQNTIVLHFGDHDPSGMDMTRDNCDRLSLFAEGYVEVKRLALNFDQVKQYDPPPNPTKLSDSRANAYMAEYGPDSWELDALDPKVMDKIVEDNIMQFIDRELWDERLKVFKNDKTKLEKAVDFVNSDE